MSNLKRKNRIKIYNKISAIAIYKLKRRKVTLITFLILSASFFAYFIWSQKVLITDGVSFENTEKAKLHDEISAMVKGYPIEQMVPYIVEWDPIVAAFLVSIAKKESAWGRHVPVLNGQDCYNYWGYRGIRDRMGTGGHTCFDSPKDAVDTVGKRIHDLVIKQNLNTPEKMIVWKCGSSCAGHSNYGVQKWISDVNLYFQKIVNKTQAEQK